MDNSDIWKEVNEVAEELLADYLELNNIGFYATLSDQPQLDIPRNWDVSLTLDFHQPQQN